MNPATRVLYALTTILLAITVWMLTLPPAHAQSVERKTLQSHIDHYCKKDCITAEALVDITSRAAKRFGFDFRALMAIIHVESKYHTKAKNGSSAGLTQVLLIYHKPKFMGRNYYAIEDNIFAGGEVFRDCFVKHKGNYPKAYSCYNGYGKNGEVYKTKVNAAWTTIKSLDLPSPSRDPIGDLIAKL